MRARVALKFSLVGTRIPAGATVDSAKIMLYVNNQYSSNGSSAQLDQEVYQINQTWGQGTLWDRAGNTTGDPPTLASSTTGMTIFPTRVTFSPLPFLGTVKWVTFNVTATVKAFWANPSSNNGFFIRGKLGGNEFYNRFPSSEFTTINQRPKLIVYSHGGTPSGITQTTAARVSQTVSVLGNSAGVVVSGFSGNARDVSISLFDMQGRNVAFDRIDNVETIQLTPRIGAPGSQVLLASVKVGASGASISYKVILK